MTRLTRDRGSLLKDDRIDALALAVHYWTAVMARDVEKAAQQQRDEELQRELDKFMEQVVGGKYQAKTSLIDR